jgi:aldose sugar dehydrogenase
VRSPTDIRARSTPSIGPWAILVACLAFPAGCSPEDAPEPLHAPPEGITRLEHNVPDCAELDGVRSPPVHIDTIASGLSVPWDMAFLPDGRILVTERTGTVRLVTAEGLQPEPWAEFDVAAVAEAGLLGIDLAPDFEKSGHVFVMMTYADVPSSGFRRLWAALLRRLPGRDGDDETTWKNRVVRLTDAGDRGVDATSSVDRLPSGPIHAGGALRFGPDGLLYLGIGDGAEPARAADASSLRGKILRFDLAGWAFGAGGDRRSPVLARGIRNPQGLSWDPLTGDLYAIDHGPTGLEREQYRRDKDELNRIVSGGDFGWPHVAGRWVGGGFETPVTEWTPAIAPAGTAFLESPGSPWHGDVFVTGLIGKQIRRVVLNRVQGGRDANGVQCEEALLEGEFGRLRAIRPAPDGSIYFGTSNRDQRGRPGPADDLLLRMRPLPGPD